jgi:hypothetical protein
MRCPQIIRTSAAIAVLGSAFAPIPALARQPIAPDAYLKASNTGADDWFGFSVAASGDTLVVGAPMEDSDARGVNRDQSNNNAPGSGAVYVFVRSGGAWTQQAYLKASNSEMGDQFGISVAISGDTIVVGARYEDSNSPGVNGDQANNNANGAGAAYVFVRSEGVWTQQAYLKASNPGIQDIFGGSVAISGDTIVVGAWWEDSAATGVDGNQNDNSADDAGAAYVFGRTGAAWTQRAYLKASNTGESDVFGWCVAVGGAASDESVLVGAVGEDSAATGVNGDQFNESAENAGAAYVFGRTGAAWAQQAYLKASNTQSEDQFAWSCAASGDSVVVGAPVEAGGSTGINGDQHNDAAPASGAAYVYVRSGGVWTQQAYVKASNTGQGDFFGTSVALAGDALLIGAPFEDSAATGIDGDQASSGASTSGAAYFYTREGAEWSHRAYIKASNTGAQDQFGGNQLVGGGGVSLTSNSAVVGAWLEDSNATGVDGNQTNENAPSAGAAYAFTIVGCRADFNHDGQLDFFDYLDFVQAFSTEDPAADFDENGQVDFFDYLDFAATFDAGCE